MKIFNMILFFVPILILIGCSSKIAPVVVDDSKKVPDNTSVHDGQVSNYDSQISYEEIITKINDANIANKNNLRTREIIKEYTYNVGDDDSRNDARAKALNQVKVLILEEMGVFVESYLEVDSFADAASRQYVREEIKTLTAGIVKTQILDERYDGRSFYIKASVLVDPDSVSEGISEVLKIRANQEEISNLQILLQSKESELDIRSQETITLQRRLTAQELINTAKENELVLLRKQLSEYQADEARLQGELKIVQDKINQAMIRIDKQSQQACLVRVGMTQREVVAAIGKPAGSNVGTFSNNLCPVGKASWCDIWHYGRSILYFNYNSKIVTYVSCGG